MPQDRRPVPSPTDTTETNDQSPAVCPYCGAEVGLASACPSCKGLQEPLSRQASQNAMGPWFVRDAASPFRPGCSIETIRMLIQRGKITRESIIRGPSTGQFWRRAGAVPGLSHLLGVCYSCRATADSADTACRVCSAQFGAPGDRQHLGLGPVRLLPGQAAPAHVAERAMEGAAYFVGSQSVQPQGTGSSSPAPSALRGATQRENAILPLAPEARPEIARGKGTLTSEEKAEKLARIEREAKLLLEERRARTQGRNAVIGVGIGLFLLAILAAVLVAIPSGPAPAPAAAPAIPPAAAPAQTPAGP